MGGLEKERKSKEKRRRRRRERERGEGEGVAESGEWVKGGIVATSRFKNGAWEIGWICCVNRETLVFLWQFYSSLL
jgi:hypothetical protein